MAWTFATHASKDVREESRSMQVDGPLRGRPKRTWIDVVWLDLKRCNLSNDLA